MQGDRSWSLGQALRSGAVWARQLKCARAMQNVRRAASVRAIESGGGVERISSLRPVPGDLACTGSAIACSALGRKLGRPDHRWREGSRGSQIDATGARGWPIASHAEHEAGRIGSAHLGRIIGCHECSSRATGDSRAASPTQTTTIASIPERAGDSKPVAQRRVVGEEEGVLPGRDRDGPQGVVGHQHRDGLPSRSARQPGSQTSLRTSRAGVWAVTRSSSRSGSWATTMLPPPGCPRPPPPPAPGVGEPSPAAPPGGDRRFPRPAAARASPGSYLPRLMDEPGAG